MLGKTSKIAMAPKVLYLLFSDHQTSLGKRVEFHSRDKKSYFPRKKDERKHKEIYGGLQEDLPKSKNRLQIEHQNLQ